MECVHHPPLYEHPLRRRGSTQPTHLLNGRPWRVKRLTRIHTCPRHRSHCFPFHPRRSRPIGSFSWLRGSIASFPPRQAPNATLHPRCSFSPLVDALGRCMRPSRARTDATTKILPARCDRSVVPFVLGSICSPVRTHLGSFGCRNGSQTEFHVRSQSIG